MDHIWLLTLFHFRNSPATGHSSKTKNLAKLFSSRETKGSRYLISWSTKAFPRKPSRCTVSRRAFVVSNGLFLISNVIPIVRWYVVGPLVNLRWARCYCNFVLPIFLNSCLSINLWLLCPEVICLYRVSECLCYFPIPGMPRLCVFNVSEQYDDHERTLSTSPNEKRYINIASQSIIISNIR